MASWASEIYFNCNYLMKPGYILLLISLQSYWPTTSIAVGVSDKIGFNESGNKSALKLLFPTLRVGDSKTTRIISDFYLNSSVLNTSSIKDLSVSFNSTTSIPPVFNLSHNSNIPYRHTKTNNASLCDNISCSVTVGKARLLKKFKKNTALTSNNIHSSSSKAKLRQARSVKKTSSYLSIGKKKILTILGLFELTQNNTRRESGESERAAAQLALDDINSNEKILPGYHITMHTNDTQVSPTPIRTFVLKMAWWIIVKIEYFKQKILNDNDREEMVSKE
jgi:hypothetical protein